VGHDVDHQEAVGLDDGEDLQIHAAIVWADPEQPVPVGVIGGDHLGLDRVDDVHSAGLADPMPTRGLGEPYDHRRSHCALHNTNLATRFIVRFYIRDVPDRVPDALAGEELSLRHVLEAVTGHQEAADSDRSWVLRR
jgi:hypothetical protein